ncbi:hypothetical protein KAX14_00990, partial [Candidatus Bipolaricaulota bacterium]|nr:hypothetical protein [Candidatus Bipolaricaulota bacterium]
MEKRLLERAQRGMKTLQGVRTPKVEDIFHRCCYIAPSDLLMEDYLRSTPLAAFNPGALLVDEKLLVFPRLIFDYYAYTSSVGMFELAIDDLLQGRIPKPLHTRILLWPTEPWEFGPGCEDPRVALWNEEIYILYTGVGQRETEQGL